MSLHWTTTTDAQDRTVHQCHDDHDRWTAPTLYREVLEIAGRFAVLDHHARVVESVHASLDAAREAVEDAHDADAESRFVHAANDY